MANSAPGGSPEADPFRILFSAKDAESLHDIRKLLEAKDCGVFCRDTLVRSMQFLRVESVDLVIIDTQLKDKKGIDLIEAIRSEEKVADLPVLFVKDGEKDGAEVSIKAFKTGVDDVIDHPFDKDEFWQRTLRLLKLRPKGKTTSLAVETTAAELPGILQLLETELKTGQLSIKSGTRSAILTLSDGRIIATQSDITDGLDVVTEVLTWEQSELSFEDGPVDDSESTFSEEITGAVMTALVAVDEYHDARSKLPKEDELFRRGSADPDEDMPVEQQEIMAQLLEGNLLESVWDRPEWSQRSATLWLKELIDRDILTVCLPPFSDYSNRCITMYAQRKSFIEPKLVDLKTVFQQILFPIPDTADFLSICDHNWISPAPRLIIGGDNAAHTKLFEQSIKRLFAASTQTLPPQRILGKSIREYRLFFSEKHIMDFQIIPPNPNEEAIRAVDDYLPDVFAVIMFISGQDTVTVNQNLRVIRLLRQHFTGAFYMIAPDVATEDDRHIFQINCALCGYILTVDIDTAGAVGECPICNAEIIVPDCLDNLVDVMRLPNDVPIVHIQPDNANHCCELTLKIIEDVIALCNSKAQKVEPALTPDQPTVKGGHQPGHVWDGHDVISTEIMPANQEVTDVLMQKATKAEPTAEGGAAVKKAVPLDLEATVREDDVDVIDVEMLSMEADDGTGTEIVGIEDGKVDAEKAKHEQDLATVQAETQDGEKGDTSFMFDETNTIPLRELSQAAQEKTAEGEEAQTGTTEESRANAQESTGLGGTVTLARHQTQPHRSADVQPSADDLLNEIIGDDSYEDVAEEVIHVDDDESFDIDDFIKKVKKR